MKIDFDQSQAFFIAEVLENERTSVAFVVSKYSTVCTASAGDYLDDIVQSLRTTQSLQLDSTIQIGILRQGAARANAWRVAAAYSLSNLPKPISDAEIDEWTVNENLLTI